MRRDGLKLALRLAAGLLGAALLALCLSALPEAQHGGSFQAAALSHLRAAFHLDLGASRISGAPISLELTRRLPATAELIGLGFIVALLIGLPFGLLFGANRALRTATPLLPLGGAVPLFVIGLGFLWLATMQHWPVGVFGGAALPSPAAPVDEWLASLRAIALPVLTVGLAGAGAVEEALRRAVAHSIDAPYRRGLRRFGLPQLEIDLHYVTPRVAAEFARHLGDIALALASAAIAVEPLYQWPGAAGYFLRAVALADWGAAAPVLFLFAAFTLLAETIGAFMARALTLPVPA